MKKTAKIENNTCFWTIVSLTLLIILVTYYVIRKSLRSRYDIKQKLIFNISNHSIISLLHFLFIFLMNYSKDHSYIMNTYHSSFRNQYKELLPHDSFQVLDKRIHNFIKIMCFLHYSKQTSIYVYSMLDTVRLENIENAVYHVIDKNIPGDFVECGVWRGGTGILIKDMLNRMHILDRHVYLLDSFEGMENLDQSSSISDVHHPTDKICSDILNFVDQYFGLMLIQTSVGEVESNLKHFNCLDDRVHLIKGWFSDEFPFHKIDQISVLRMDCDYYYPTMICLKHLYPKISVGGVIILDEYYLDFMGERYAVDEFRKENNITSKIIRVDRNVAYWIKE